MPARMAFCCTAAAVRPSFFATWLVGVPAFASCFKVRSSPALQEAPSLEGRFAIIHSPLHTRIRADRDHTRIHGRVGTPTWCIDMLEITRFRLSEGGKPWPRGAGNRPVGPVRER